MQVTVTRLQPSEWPANVPHDKIDIRYNSAQGPLTDQVEVHDIVRFDLDGHPWLWQAVHWTDLATSSGVLFDTFDEHGNQVEWVGANKDTPDIFWAVEGWFASEVGRTQITDSNGVRTSVPWNGYTTAEGYDADDVEAWMDVPEEPLQEVVVKTKRRKKVK